MSTVAGLQKGKKHIKFNQQTVSIKPVERIVLGKLQPHTKSTYASERKILVMS